MLEGREPALQQVRDTEVAVRMQVLDELDFKSCQPIE
jgi:hypothetical protein